MGFLWVLGAIAAGTLAALLAGAVLDYLQVRHVLPASFTAWLFLPYTMGAAGLLSSIISIAIYGRYLRGRSESRATGTAKGQGRTPAGAVPKGMDHVPGMPVFDVEAIREGRAGPPAGQGEPPARPREAGDRLEQQ